MPLVYLSTGWLMGIWAASMLALPTEMLLLAVLVPLIGLALWWRERRIRLMWLAALCAIFGGLRYQFSLPHFDRNSLSTYNNVGEVTIEGVIIGFSLLLSISSLRKTSASLHGPVAACTLIGLRYAPSGHRWAGVDSVWEQEKLEARKCLREAWRRIPPAGA
jgi:hypothetical protein